MILGTKGIAAVRVPREGVKVPAYVTSWQQNLIAWSTAAKLIPLSTPPAAGNPYGITAKTTRKS